VRFVVLRFFTVGPVVVVLVGVADQVLHPRAEVCAWKRRFAATNGDAAQGDDEDFAEDDRRAAVSCRGFPPDRMLIAPQPQTAAMKIIQHDRPGEVIHKYMRSRRVAGRYAKLFLLLMMRFRGFGAGPGW
jgi:hypothetical protein